MSMATLLSFGWQGYFFVLRIEIVGLKRLTF